MLAFPPHIKIRSLETLPLCDHKETSNLRTLYLSQFVSAQYSADFQNGTYSIITFENEVLLNNNRYYAMELISYSDCDLYIPIFISNNERCPYYPMNESKFELLLKNIIAL